jgi:hypothetical protein
MQGETRQLPISSAVVGVLLGTVAAVIWIYANIQIFGYLALWRVTDHWPAIASFGIPVILFGIAVVPPTYYLLSRLPPGVALVAVLSCVSVYFLIGMYSHIAVQAMGIGWLSFGVTMVIVTGEAFIAWRLLKQDSSKRVD